MPDLEFPHLFLQDGPTSSDYTSTNKRGGQLNIQQNINRSGHADFVKTELEKVWQESETKQASRTSASLPISGGTYIEFESAAGFDLNTKSLDLRRSNIRLANVRERTNSDGSVTTLATVFVPKGKERILLNKVEKYKTEDTDGQEPKPKNQQLVESINAMRLAMLEAMWPDPVSMLPDSHTKTWCEAWLRAESENIDVEASFKETCQRLSIALRDESLHFPERTVMLISVSRTDLEELVSSFPYLAEFRIAKETAAFWSALTTLNKRNGSKILKTGSWSGTPIFEAALLIRESITVIRFFLR